MNQAQSSPSVFALTLIAMVAFIVPTSASPQNSTLDAQIEHGGSGCEGSSPEKTVFGLIPPGFDYRFTVTNAPDVRPVPETHLKLVAGWERSFRRSAVSGANIGELKRELRLVGSKASAWLLAEESDIDELLQEVKPGKPVTYEVALLGCTGSAGSFDVIMALKEFEVEADQGLASPRSTFRDELVTRPPDYARQKCARVLEQPMRFKTAWVGVGIPNIRECDGTYGIFPSEDLPPLEAEAGLDWLEPLHPQIASQMLQYRPNSEMLQQYNAWSVGVLEQARTMKLSIPDAVGSLIASEELRNRFPSATACYFDLPKSVSSSPFSQGDHILRFLNDQQICVCWYLHFSGDGAPTVIASMQFGDPNFLEDVDRSDSELVTEWLAETYLVAPNAEVFLYRYWIENCIWMKLNERLPLSRAEQSYVRHYKNRTD